MFFNSVFHSCFLKILLCVRLRSSNIRTKALLSNYVCCFPIRVSLVDRDVVVDNTY